jgi:uncharacterized membrane protein HdeD (DUF308 family)/UDP-2,3-diacylglucosamine pyrophosphatase LpxH
MSDDRRSEATRDIFVISDLHVGDGGVRDNFEPGGRTRRLHQFLDHVGAEGGELFILGDLFELWQMNTSRIFVHRRSLLDHFVQLPLVYVPGNHDVDLLSFIGTGFLEHPFFSKMRRPFDRKLGGRRFRFFHGHETDPFNASEQPGFGQMLTIFAGLFEDQNKSPLLASGETVEAVLEQFGESMLALWTCATATLSARIGIEGDVEPREALTPAQNPDRIHQHLQGVREVREREGWDVAVLGHTHKLGCVGDWYHNSGSWVGSQNSYLRIDPEGHVRYFAWKEGRAVEQQAPRVLPEIEVKKDPVKKALASVRLLFPRPTPPERSRLSIMAQGVLALGLGLWAFFRAHTQGRAFALSTLIWAFGVYCLVDGGLSLLAASRQQPVKRVIDRLRGSVSILLGLVLLSKQESFEVFAVLVGAWALFSGVLRTAAAAVFRRMVEGRWLWIVGIGSIVAGLILLFLPTSVSAVLLADIVAGYLCFHGAAELFAGIFGRRRGRGAWWNPWRIQPGPMPSLERSAT